MDTGDVLELIQEVAGRVVNPRFRALDPDAITEKKPGDLVTVADHEAEIEITRALVSAYPEALVLGEEACAADASLIDRFGHAEHAFTVDPIDGTLNFVEGSPDHATMVSEVRRGEVVRAWIYQPQHEAAFVAERGGGAWRNGERLPLLDIDPDRRGWRLFASRAELVDTHLDGMPPFRRTWMSCGIDYPQLASGHADALVYRHGMPWDHAPGSLLLAETGGHLGLCDGSDYPLSRPDATPRAGGLVAAAGRAVYDAVVAGLRGVVV